MLSVSDVARTIRPREQYEQVYYQREPYRRVSTPDLIALFMAEASSPPPCPVLLASLPMPVPEPPEGRPGVAWLTRTARTPHDARALRSRPGGPEKKDEDANRG